MSNIEELKKVVIEILERNFIDNKKAVEKEMNMLNLLMSSFDKNAIYYSYDDYCKSRMKFEIEACDKAVDKELVSPVEMSISEKNIIRNRAVRKVMGNPELEYEEVVKDEFIKWNIDKFSEIDEKIYYQLSKYSSMKLIKNKVSSEVWKNKKVYFDEICEHKAKNVGKDFAKANREPNENYLRSKMM